MKTPQLPPTPGADVAPSSSTEPNAAVAAITETKIYPDGTTVTGPGPLPDDSPTSDKPAA